MSSIGPQLPPSPSKRKQNDDKIALDSGSDEGFGPSAPKPAVGPTLPPSNTDEIALDESDDDFGPSAPATSVGPTLPPTANTTNNDEIALDESDSEDDYGPAAPSKPSAGPTLPSNPPVADSDSDSDSDDDYGPSLPSAHQKPTMGPSMPPSEDPSNPNTSAAPAARDDWMLAPPTNTGYQERDPTKLKSRKFTSKPFSEGGKSSKGGEIASIWTETPEQKLERLRNSVLGRSEPSASNRGAPAQSRPERPSPPPKEEEEGKGNGKGKRRKLGDRDVQEEESKRGKKRGFERTGEEDDPSKRAFDREKDMAIGGAMSGKQRNEFLTQARNFGNRFTKGSSTR